jgi:hypothetical protein
LSLCVSIFLARTRDTNQHPNNAQTNIIHKHARERGTPKATRAS